MPIFNASNPMFDGSNPLCSSLFMVRLESPDAGEEKGYSPILKKKNKLNS